MVEIRYKFSPGNLVDSQIIGPSVVPQVKPYCLPVRLGDDDNSQFASRYFCFYRSNTNRYYGAQFYYEPLDEKNKEGGQVPKTVVVVTCFTSVRQYSSEIPPNEVIPIPDEE
ncbi:MAG: hypothetical protein NZM26_03220 [Patescibacteria group bacterium]|nr:hypothetical protein [Patescibacteria group bacterium]